jgi:hypothetical protein
VLYGINRAFAGFAVQQTDSAYDRFAHHVFDVLCLPDRVLPPPASVTGNLVPIAADFVWSFILCLVVSAAYHAVPRHVPNPNDRSA